MIEENNRNPLVSVAVVTYNSSATIIETLDSISNQTYQNIELIVSDDCSTDETVNIAKQWIREHQNRFIRAEILTISNNMGVSANYNRAMDACRGEWVKDVDGDDLLCSTCVEEYVSYVRAHSDAYYVFSRVKCIGGSEADQNRVSSFFDYSFFLMSSEQQLERLIWDGNCINSSTFFYNKEQLQRLGIRNIILSVFKTGA